MAVTCQPNRLNSMPMAISLTIGLAIRKLNVTPIGTPAATNPMNAGTALQEQNGVITPSPAAITLPTPSRLPPSRARVRSMLMYDRSTVTMKMIATSSSAILIVSYTKKCTVPVNRASGSIPDPLYSNVSHNQPFTQYTVTQAP